MTIPWRSVSLAVCVEFVALQKSTRFTVRRHKWREGGGVEKLFSHCYYYCCCCCCCTERVAYFAADFRAAGHRHSARFITFHYDLFVLYALTFNYIRPDGTLFGTTRAKLPPVWSGGRNVKVQFCVRARRSEVAALCPFRPFYLCQ